MMTDLQNNGSFDTAICSIKFFCFLVFFSLACEPLEICGFFLEEMTGNNRQKEDEKSGFHYRNKLHFEI